MTNLRNDLTIYDGVADRWWSDEVRWVRTVKNMVPARLRYFDRFVDWQGQRVLNLRCVGGFISEALAARGAQVTGLDPASEAIAAAVAHAKASGYVIKYDVGVGEALPYANECFDAVVCVDVLEHVLDLPRILREVARVLRPGGMFLFDTINQGLLARFVTVTVAEGWLRLLPPGILVSGLPVSLRQVRTAGIVKRHLSMSVAPSGRKGPITTVRIF